MAKMAGKFVLLSEQLNRRTGRRYSMYNLNNRAMATKAEIDGMIGDPGWPMGYVACCPEHGISKWFKSSTPAYYGTTRDGFCDKCEADPKPVTAKPAGSSSIDLEATAKALGVTAEDLTAAIALKTPATKSAAEVPAAVEEGDKPTEHVDAAAAIRGSKK